MKSDTRESRVKIAEETMSILDSGRYKAGNLNVDIEGYINKLEQTSFIVKHFDRIHAITNDKLERLRYETLISVDNIGVMEAAQKLSNKGLFPGILNFASAERPGGGWLSGSQAQEECITRSSSLYKGLISQSEYYEKNKKIPKETKDYFYNNIMIYCPEVIVFRSENGDLLQNPYSVDVLTSPAPNYRQAIINNPSNIPNFREVMHARIDKILSLFKSQDIDTLVLGAFGCGVFGCPPEIVAECFKDLLYGKYKNAFKQIIFAIKSKDGVNFNAFKSIL